MFNIKTIATAISAGALALSMTSVNAAEITGAGASFPAPVYAKWADAYNKETGHKVNYQSIGSGGGIKQISAKTVDFGASDMPLKPEDLKEKGLMQFPTVIGGVVPVVNLQGVAPGQMKLTGEVLANIYLNKITKWNDKAIADLNPGVKLPDQDISVIRRADGSGDAYLFAERNIRQSSAAKAGLSRVDIHCANREYAAAARGAAAAQSADDAAQP